MYKMSGVAYSPAIPAGESDVTTTAAEMYSDQDRVAGLSGFNTTTDKLGLAGEELRRAQMQANSAHAAGVPLIGIGTSQHTGSHCCESLAGTAEGDILCYWCPTCGKGFKNSYDLRRHQDDSRYCEYTTPVRAA
jgi:hypothetical protein